MPGVVWLIGRLGGWQQTFWFLGAIGVLFAIAWFALFRNSPETHYAVSEAERDHIVANRQPRLAAVTKSISSGNVTTFASAYFSSTYSANDPQ